MPTWPTMYNYENAIYIFCFADYSWYKPSGSPSFLLQISHSFFSLLTVSTCFLFSVLMALLASHCFSLYWVSISLFFSFSFLNSFYGADCLFWTTWRKKKRLIFLCIWLMTLIKSNWICNEVMLLLNGYWIKIMNFYFSGCFSVFIGMKYFCIDVFTWILLKVIGFAMKICFY